MMFNSAGQRSCARHAGALPDDLLARMVAWEEQNECGDCTSLRRPFARTTHARAEERSFKGTHSSHSLSDFPMFDMAHGVPRPRPVERTCEGCGCTFWNSLNLADSLCNECDGWTGSRVITLATKVCGLCGHEFRTLPNVRTCSLCRDRHDIADEDDPAPEPTRRAPTRTVDRPRSRVAQSGIARSGIRLNDTVFASDRQNYGRVLQVNKRTNEALVYFINKERGTEATVWLPLSALTAERRHGA